MSDTGTQSNATGADAVRRDLIAVMPRLLRFARVITRPPLDAEDLLQMTCERALSRHAQFNPGTRFDSWTFAIMHSIWKNELRRLGVERSVSEAMPIIDREDGERKAFGKILLADVLSAMKHLPAEQAAAMTLVNIDGLSYADAAAALGIPQGTLESRIARGRIALGRVLDDTTQSADAMKSATSRRAEASKP